MPSVMTLLDLVWKRLTLIQMKGLDIDSIWFLILIGVHERVLEEYTWLLVCVDFILKSLWGEKLPHLFIYLF